MNSRTKTIPPLIAILVAVLGACAPARAQNPADTIAAWTEDIRSGTLLDRVTAAAVTRIRERV